MSAYVLLFFQLSKAQMSYCNQHFVLEDSQYVGYYVGEGKIKYSEQHGSNNFPNLISFPFRHEAYSDFLLSFPGSRFDLCHIFTKDMNATNL
jgi:hypothetical protein